MRIRVADYVPQTLGGLSVFILNNDGYDSIRQAQ